MPANSQEDDRVTVRYDGEHILLQGDDGQTLSIPRAEFAIIGDMCVEEPYTGEYAYMVVVLRDGTWHVVPLHATGFDELQHALERELECDLMPRLDQPRYDSRVFWPAALRDKQLVVIKTRAETLLERAFDALTQHFSYGALSDDVAQYLKGRA